MKRILQIGMTSNYGGIESLLVNLYDKLDRNRFHFDFIDMEGSHKTIAYSEEIERMGGKIFKIPSRRENIFKNRNYLKRIILNGNYSYIHNNLSSWSYAEGIRIPLNFNSGKVIVHSHNSNIESNVISRRIMDRLNRHLNNNPQLIRLACGEEAGEWLFGNEHFSIIPNGIDTKKYQFNPFIREKYRKSFNISNSEKVYLNVGRMSIQKNHIFLLKSFKEILREQPKSLLVLVGNGELRDDLINLAAKMKISQRVKFLGIRNDVENIMQMSDCFILPSLWEGLPIALIEAQASGLPCFVSQNISQEAFLTNYVKKINIDESPKLVSNFILKSVKELKVNRLNATKYVKDAGYDLSRTVEMIKKIYSGK